MRALAILRCGLFLLTLFVPLTRMHRAGEMLPNERRERLPLPSLSAAGLHFPEQFDAYVRDNFGGRDSLIHWHHVFEFRVFRQSPVGAVIVGGNGWLFYAAPDDGLDIRNFTGRFPHQPSDVEAWLAALDAREREYAQLGARYLIAIAPDKQSIYPELVPARYGPPAPGVMQEVLRQLPSHPRLEVLDLAPVMRAHRDEQPYYKGDSHWNGQGAFLAAQAIAGRLHNAMPQVGLIRDADYTVETTAVGTGDLVNMLGLGIDVPDRLFVYRRKSPGAQLVQQLGAHSTWEQPGTRLPKALLIGDSYGVALAPILADAFSRLHFHLSSLDGRDPGLAAREKPDVVILISVERYLPKMADR